LWTQTTRTRDLIRPKHLFLFALIFLAACYRGAATQDVTSGIGSEPTPEQIVVTNTVPPPPTETPSPTPLPSPSFPDPAGYGWNLVAEGFRRPLLLTHAGDGSGRIFVVGQDGGIWIVENGAPRVEAFLDITEQVGSSGNEQGLLGLAFHPDYENNGIFFVHYSDLNGDTVVSRFQVSGDANLADPASETILLQYDQPYPNHNGGQIEFGPDGYLYIGLGDGGSGGDPQGNGQSLDTLLGKILRIDVNSGSPYGIPADNPFVNDGGLPEIWAYGLRNPWRFSFDRATGDLFIGDVGQGEWEEIDFLPAGIVGGTNLGWNYLEGTHPYEGEAPDGLVPPVTEYNHGSGCSVTGGYVYRGAAMPEWQGVYIYGDYCSGQIFGLVQHEDGAWESRLLFETGFELTSFGEDESGELYALDRGGSVYQLQAQ
jgi:glucose/arabinose dehydrogenase